MPPKLLYDLNGLDLSRVEFDIEEIRKTNPHRYEFEQLSGIIRMIPEEAVIIGYKDVRPDEFWVRGHIPGFPLMPGVLQVEAAAQLCSFYHNRNNPNLGFFGFGGIDEVRFRGSVKPGDKLILIAKAVQVNPRRSIYAAQGVVGEKLVLEANIFGILIPTPQKQG